MEQEKFPFDVEYQKKLIALMCKDITLLMKCSKYLKKEYFETDILKWAYTTMLDYYFKYQAPITQTVFVTEMSELRKKNDPRLLEYCTIVKDLFSMEVSERQFILDKLKEFIQRNLYIQSYTESTKKYNDPSKDSFLESVRILNRGIDDIKQVTFDKQNCAFFFEELQERISKRYERINMGTLFKYSTGINELDEFTDGGLGRGELGIIVADSGVGKSIGLINIGATNILARDANVLHFGLEGRLSQVEDRYEARILNHNYREISRSNMPTNAQVQYSRLTNKLVICNLLDRWDYSAIDLENIMLDLKSKHFIPDLVIVDYGDLLAARESKDYNTYLLQQETFRDLKTMANKYNVAMWTASQTTRPPKDRDPKMDDKFFYTRKHLADSYAKLRIADLLITLNMTDMEKQSNKMRIYVDKLRDSECGHKIYINTNYANMQFYVPNTQVMKNFTSESMKPDPKAFDSIILPPPATDATDMVVPPQ